MTAKILFTLALVCAPAVAWAHAFGQQYTLPLPAGLYIVGGSVALLLSFYVILIFPRAWLERGAGKLPRQLVGPSLAGWLVALARFGAGACVGATLAAGLLGPPGPTENIAPILFWIYFLLGFAYFSVFVRGLWEQVSPFSISLLKARPPRLTLPAWAHHVPALALYALLLWLELLSYGGAAAPPNIALGLMGYFVLCQVGMWLYGKDVWVEHFEVFGVFFRTVGFLAPVSFEQSGVYYLPGRIRHAAAQSADSVGLVVFILSVLAFTAFDGFRETMPFSNALLAFSAVISPDWFERISFFIFPAAFFGIYAGTMYFVARVEHTGMSLSQVLCAYAYSFVPIAVVYHVAHYFTLLITESQLSAALALAPFGISYTPNPGIIGADHVWYIQVCIIVAGHVVALVISHLTTHRLIVNRKQALLAELPLVGVMVLYTAFGLWILSRPFAL